MAQDRFIEKHKTAWQRLEDLLKLLDGSSLRKLHREEVRELGRIYRRTASDLAIARAESRDPRLINYLNSLVIRAHGRIYQADAQGGSRIKEFFVRDLPQAFRRTWRYTAVSFSVFAVFSVIGFMGTKYDPEFSELVGVPPTFREVYIETKTHWWEDLNEANQIGASRIMTNNVQVTIYTFAFGALFGVGTLFFLAYNGATIAAVAGAYLSSGFWKRPTHLHGRARCDRTVVHLHCRRCGFVNRKCAVDAWQPLARRRAEESRQRRSSFDDWRRGGAGGGGNN